MPDRPLVALLTDFGTRDHYVGVMKGVMRQISPEIDFIDITHAIPPQDVRAAAFILMNSYTYFPPHTTFLVVVDPGVGTPRRPVVVQTMDNYNFIIPDNGILTYSVKSENTKPRGMSWQDGRLEFELTRDTEIHAAWKIVSSPIQGYISNTFHGRDVFAPGAARVAATPHNRPLDPTYFKPIDEQSLVKLPPPIQAFNQDALSGEVLYIDHFGNIITSIGRLIWREDESLVFDPLFHMALPQLQTPAQSNVVIGEHQFDQINRTYGAVSPGEPLALIGSTNMLEIAINHGNAAEFFGVSVGDTVTLHIPQEEH
ncbi:MAG: SAM-dependent chlorinase/fluorinase [Chloroflexota bacterium]